MSNPGPYLSCLFNKNAVGLMHMKSPAFKKLKPQTWLHLFVATSLGFILAQASIHYFTSVSSSSQPSLFLAFMECCKWLYYGAFLLLVHFIYGFFYNMYQKHLDGIKINQQATKDLKLTLIKNQLDPHFIFNALNSIAFSINKDEKTVAYNNLGVFSKLMRETIVSLDNFSRTIEEEVAYVNHYLYLEKFRFKSRFSFDVIVAPGTSLITEVPKMCVFCFVEAALKKGILPGEQSGHIDITIDGAEKKDLFITVIDNGLHRNLNNTPLDEQSASIKAVSKTINYLNTYNSNKIEITCRDLGSNTVNKGSKISIFIPGNFDFSN